jgi:rod shape-determining protein MreC
VGIVVEVGSDHAFVRLLSDTRSLVIGLDVTSRATGEIRGRLSSPLAMLNVPVTQRVEIDDRVVSAGLDLGRGYRSSVPKGLLIGRVVDVRRDPAAVVQTALVEPAADLEGLELALVITDQRGPRPPAAEGTPEP